MPKPLTKEQQAEKAYVNELIDLARVTNQWLADQLGVTWSAVTAWRNGPRRIPPGRITEIEQALLRYAADSALEVSQLVHEHRAARWRRLNVWPDGK